MDFNRLVKMQEDTSVEMLLFGLLCLFNIPDGQNKIGIILIKNWSSKLGFGMNLIFFFVSITKWKFDDGQDAVRCQLPP